MILSLFVFLCILSLALIYIGVSMDADVYIVLGCGFLFYLAALVLLVGNVEVPAGSTTLTNYTYDNSTLTSTLETETTTYNALEGGAYRWFGIYLSIGAALGATAVFFRQKSRRPGEE